MSPFVIPFYLFVMSKFFCSSPLVITNLSLVLTFQPSHLKPSYRLTCVSFLQIINQRIIIIISILFSSCAQPFKKLVVKVVVGMLLKKSEIVHTISIQYCIIFSFYSFCSCHLVGVTRQFLQDPNTPAY